MLILGGENKIRCKGVKECVVKSTINHETFMSCYLDRVLQMRKMKIIRSREHILNTVTVNKKAISCDDDKRIEMEDKVNTQYICLWTLCNTYMGKILE